MRSLSRIIKSSRVNYDRDPRTLTLNEKGVYVAMDAGKVLSDGTLENADIKLRFAVDEAKEITRRGRVEAEVAFLSSVDEGKRRGRGEGFAKGSGEGAAESAAEVRAAAKNFTARSCSLDMRYLKSLGDVKAECVDFAFRLAEEVLGIAVDRDDPECAALTDGFLRLYPYSASLTVDGADYNFETRAPGRLLECAEGLSELVVRAEPIGGEPENGQHEDKTENNIETAEKTTEKYKAEKDEADKIIDEKAPATGETATEDLSVSAPSPEDIPLPATATSPAFAESAALRSGKISADREDETAEAEFSRLFDDAPDEGAVPEAQPAEDESVVSQDSSKQYAGEETPSQNLPRAEENAGTAALAAEPPAERISAEAVSSEALEPHADVPREREAPDDNVGTPALSEAEEEAEDGDTPPIDGIDSEKFVFVRPARKSAPITAQGARNGELSFGDLEKLSPAVLKALTRSAEIKDIATALNGAADGVAGALMGSLTRRMKENVLDVIKYLGPVPQAETSEARERLVALAGGILERRERGGNDVER